MRIALFCLVLALSACASAPPAGAPITAPPTDLHQYFLVLLVNPGPERIPMPEDVFAGHMAYMNSHTASDVYKFGGPVTDGGHIRGIVVVDAENIEAVRAILANDPAVRAGVLAPEIH